MDQPALQRRSFSPRFSLRTLLVVLTLAGIFVAWQARWMKERRAYLVAHPKSRYSEPGQKTVSAPMLMGIWREAGETELMVSVPGLYKNRESYKISPAPEAAEVRRLFPESIITVKEGITIWYTWHPGEKWNWDGK
jgi:hypothetical protein